jgi:hypothetical protein
MVQPSCVRAFPAESTAKTEVPHKNTAASAGSASADPNRKKRDMVVSRLKDFAEISNFSLEKGCNI